MGCGLDGRVAAGERESFERSLRWSSLGVQTEFHLQKMLEEIVIEFGRTRLMQARCSNAPLQSAVFTGQAMPLRIPGHFPIAHFGGRKNIIKEFRKFVCEMQIANRK